MKNNVLAAAAAILVIGCSTVVCAAEKKIALCEYCNSSAFRSAAEVTALSEPPRLVEGTQYVFVVDTGTDEIRYYEVVRENVEICQSSDDASVATISTDPVIDPDEPGPEIPECFSNWVPSSTQLAPPADQLAEIRSALDEVDKFLAEIRDLDARDLDFGDFFPIDSATDLIGPDGTPHDYYNVSSRQQTFMNAISDDITNTWWERAYWDAQSTAAAAVAKYFGTVAQAIVIAINFEDGTQISVKLTTLLRDEDGKIVGFEMEIESGSALLNDERTPIPTDIGDFSDTFRNPFTANSSLINNLSDLFVRGGGRIERNTSGGGGCTSTMECFTREDADGNPEQVCRVTVPDPQLSGC